MVSADHATRLPTTPGPAGLLVRIEPAGTRREEAAADARSLPARCQHRPPCPAPTAADHAAARVVAAHPEQGWSLLCNGVVTFDDTGELLPDGQLVGPHRGPAPHRTLRSADAGT